MPLNRGVNLGGWLYDVEPDSGDAYSTVLGGLWFRAEAPRLAGPVFRPPDPHVMRDPTLATSWASSGGAPIIERAAFRSMLPPWRKSKPGG